MSILAQTGLYILAGLLLLAGVSHFLRPHFYTRMIPLWFPAHKFAVAFSGVLEIVLGIGLLMPATRSISAWATIAMLASYLLVHFHMAIGKEAGLGLPKWALWTRIMLQFVLMWWALSYT
jgi:uncharacterized membrane protein